MDTNIHESFIQLVRLGIGTGTVSGFKFQNSIDWEGIKAFAEKQGLDAIVLDGIEEVRCKKEDRKCDVVMPSQEIMLQWIGEVLQDYDNRYDAYKKTIAEMAGFYNAHGYKMMIIKGYACCLDWPKPEHRPVGDIDIWQFGQQKEADAALAKETGVEIDSSHHHHTVFCWGEFMVENHYDFINVHHHQSHKEFERILKQLGNDGSHIVEVYGEKVYLPSPNLHALFLLKHLMLHFASGNITIRQVLDWAFFMEKHSADVDWDWFCSVMDEFQMRDFSNIINAICVEDLGFSATIFHDLQFNPFLKDRVLKDILNPEFGDGIPKNLFVRIIWKFRRWKANKWKHKLCYKESMWSAFWYGVWGHIIKPKSI